MEDKRYPIWKHGLTYGLYTGVGLIVLSLIWYILDMYTERWVSWISYAVLLTGVVFASIHYRDKYNNGFISYGQSFSAGFYTSLFASIITSIYTFVFMTYAGEEFAQIMLDAAEENILSRNPEISDQELDIALDWTSRMFKPGWMTAMALLGNTVMGLIFALIASIFIKKEEQVG